MTRVKRTMQRQSLSLKSRQGLLLAGLAASTPCSRPCADMGTKPINGMLARQPGPPPFSSSGAKMEEASARLVMAPGACCGEGQQHTV